MLAFRSVVPPAWRVDMARIGIGGEKKGAVRIRKVAEFTLGEDAVLQEQAVQLRHNLLVGKKFSLRRR